MLNPFGSQLGPRNKRRPHRSSSAVGKWETIHFTWMVEFLLMILRLRGTVSARASLRVFNFARGRRPELQAGLNKPNSAGDAVNRSSVDAFVSMLVMSFGVRERNAPLLCPSFTSVER